MGAAPLDRFAQAHNQKNFDDISQLINWEGVSKYKQKIVRVYTKANFSRQIVKTEFQEADTEFLGPKSVMLGRVQRTYPERA